MSVLSELVGPGLSREEAKEKRDRLARAEGDFFYFCTYYFPHYFGSEPALYHRILIDIISSGKLTEAHIEALKPLIKEKYHCYMKPTDEILGIIDAEPRGFSKSTRFGLALPLWFVLFKKKNFPILFSASQEMANTGLESIKDELTQNERIYEDFGDMRGKIWKASKITLANGTAIAARGAGASTRGIKNGPYRPDVAICDDILTDELALSKSLRDKRFRWIKRVVLPLGKNILPVFINTIFHEDDVICRLFKELVEGRLSGWVGFRFAARERGEEDAPSLWPSYWPDAALRKKREEVGSAAWSTEYMNEPLSSEDAIIKIFHYYDLSEIDDAKMTYYGGIDPATGVHDKCAFDTLGDQHDGILYVRDSWGERLGEQPFLEKIVATYLLWRHALIGFEDVAFQSIYKNNLMEKAAALGVWLPMAGFKVGTMSKVGKAKKLAPLIEAGFIRFLATQKELLEQLAMMTPDGPKSAYDDEFDALYIAWEKAQEGRAGAPPLAIAFERFGMKSLAKTIMRGFKR